MIVTAKKIVITILVVIVLVIAALFVAAWNYGVFAKVEISVEDRGPFHFVYLQKQGPFSEISAAWEEAEALFEEQQLAKGIGCGEYLDDPALVEAEELRWRVGFLVPDSVSVKEPLSYKRLPQHTYVIATVKAHPMVAPFKTYPALEEWGKTSAYQFVGMAYELYPDEGVVEVLFPVDKI